MLAYVEKKENIKGIKLVGLLLAAPFVGLFYFLLLPIISISMVLETLAVRIWRGLRSLTSILISFEWRPTLAYLKGKRSKKNK